MRYSSPIIVPTRLLNMSIGSFACAANVNAGVNANAGANVNAAVTINVIAITNVIAAVGFFAVAWFFKAVIVLPTAPEGQMRYLAQTVP